uniref:Uncharacterized protein n=1 Tax=Avena sativa TaxID=4498 RepID=A0ACD6A5X8_AVESA
MPLGKDIVSSTATGRDRISALPDDTIHHVLGFLSADQAVRTSLLAREWRHHWKYLHSLRITLPSPSVLETVEELNSLMRGLLLDQCAHLNVCSISDDYGDWELDDEEVDRWIRHAVCARHARVLTVNLGCQVSGEPLISRYLLILKLYNVVVEDTILDFKSCTSLEYLEIAYCEIYATKISSQSVKRMRIIESYFLRMDLRCRISAPNTVSLLLDDVRGTNPLFQSMPLLQTAFLRLDYHHASACNRSDYLASCGMCEECTAKGGCMLLGCLSTAAHLELIAPMAKFTDLRCCPTFRKLKTLMLDDWCMSADLRALICILQHCPILEKLTVQLYVGYEHLMVSEESSHAVMQFSTIPKHLCVVEIKYLEVDERVNKILKIFGTFDIKVNINQARSTCSSYNFLFQF